MKRILVCGGRNYGVITTKNIGQHPMRRRERRVLRETLDELLARNGEPFLLIHGGASGADLLADSRARNRQGIIISAYPANWYDIDRPGAVVRTRRDGSKYDLLAGFVRNQKMLDEGKPDLCIAFPGGTGTADMIIRARTANIEVKEIS